MSHPFAGLVTKASLAKLAGERSFARGLAYFESGAVLDLVQTRDGVKARVLASEEYRAALVAVARDHDLTAYDASYLDLALALRYSVACRDGPLRNVLHAAGLKLA